MLPCGAGKTIVGIAAMALMQRSTLVLTTSITAVKQWHREILDKTDLTEDQVAEYTGEIKDIGPVTLATYQILTHRPDKKEEFPHFKLFDQRDWGLIIYDEVHLLPAPVFRVTAQIQARRRLGLTATLVREDGREDDVFSLIGPKKYDVPWRELEIARLDRRGHLHRGPRGPARAAAHGIRRGRVAQQVPPRQREPGQGRRGGPPAGALPGQPGAHHRPVPQAAAAAAQALRHPAHHRPDAQHASARTCTTSSAAARCGS